MTGIQRFFFQRMQANGNEVPIQSIARGVYIEHVNLDGPQLILLLNDTDSALRDDVKLVDGAKLTVKMGDPNARGDTYFSVNFVVVGVSPESTQIRVEALEAGVHAIKQPATKPLAFINQKPADILKALFPGYKINAEFKDKLTYHVTTGATASSVLRLMERDLGAAIWVSRGVVNCIPYNKLAGQKDGYPIFEYQNQASKHPIFAHAPAHQAEASKRVARRHYMSWDTVAGLQKGASNQDAPPSYVPAVPAAALDNLSSHLVPTLLCDMPGNGLYCAGMTVGVRLHRYNNDRVIDESLPLKQAILVVSHIQEFSTYKCKVTTGVAQ